MRRRRKRKRIALTVFILSAGLLTAAACFPVWIQNRRADDEKERLLNDYLEPDGSEKTGEDGEMKQDGGGGTDTVSAQNPSTDPLYRRFNFEGLQKINPEIVGWLYVPGTQIDYPVCRGSDNSYYLTHTAEKRKNPLGAIFVPSETDEKLRAAHVLFYGHNMKSGKMFGDLSSYCEKSFREKYPYIYIYTPETASRSIVFSIFQTNYSGNAFTIGYQPGTEQYEKWQSEMINASLYDCGYLPDVQQQIFTLSTCADSGSAQDRLVVHCAVTESVQRDGAAA